MIRQYRAWLPDQSEPIDDFPIRAAATESAAKNFLIAHHGLGSLELTAASLPILIDLKRKPQLVLVREMDSFRAAPHRINVTAEIEAAIWGYPEEIDAEVRL